MHDQNRITFGPGRPGRPMPETPGSPLLPFWPGNPGEPGCPGTPGGPGGPSTPCGPVENMQHIIFNKIVFTHDKRMCPSKIIFGKKIPQSEYI